MQLDEAIDERCSVREFSSEKVDWGLVLDAVDAACRVPLAGNINNLKFIIVEDQNLKNKITQNCQQDWVADAPIVVVVCADEMKLEKLYDERAEIYSRQQAGAAIQTFLLKLTELNLSSCWVGAYSDELVKQCLKIPEHINIEAIIPIGHRTKSCKTKQAKKKDLENVINWDTWGTKNKPKEKGLEKEKEKRKIKN